MTKSGPALRIRHTTRVLAQDGLADIDVIVPVLDGGTRFDTCLAALASQEGVRLRVIVVDNGSRDGSGARAAAAGALVVHESRRSSYAARNRGLAESSAPVIAFTDADCVPERGWAAAGLEALTRHGFDLAAGAVNQEPGRTLAGRHDALTYLDQEEFVRRGYAATANLFVRREVLGTIGPFLADLRSGGDLELTQRAVAAGFRLGYEPSATVSHPPRQRMSALLGKAWRISVGHGELIAAGQRRLRPALSWRRLLPPPAVRRAGLDLAAVNVTVRLVSYVGRVVGLARALARRPRRAAS